ncbi:hypothetical protein LCGC14_2260300 [marine sediment metagenome]|uniref:Uncharacterized protein n=1 Tax=marine sediment metagenome TaxID=412755 RepID=A0A0F9DMA6_9ZZZZ
MSIVEIVLALTVLLDRLKGRIMQTIGVSLKCDELHLQPEREGNVQLSPDMQQVLSLVTGFSKNERIVIQASPVGSLRTTSPRIQDIMHIEGSGANDQVQGSDLPCSEVMCMGEPTNTGTIWVRTLKDATVTNAWPLGVGEVITLSMDNYRDLRALIVTHADVLICAIA